MKNIYRKIRQIRLSKHLTLTDISKQTGLSTSFLSQMERGKCDITLTSLNKIAAILGIDLRMLFDDESYSTKYYHPASDHKRLDTGHSFLKYFKLSSDFEEKQIDVIRVVCQPHSMPHSLSEYETHSGEECFYILKGQATFIVDNVIYVVKEGETIHFPSTLSHFLGNDGDEEMVAVAAITKLAY